MEYFGYYLLIGFILGGLTALRMTDKEIEKLDPEDKVIYEMVGKSGIIFVSMLLWPLALMLNVMSE